MKKVILLSIMLAIFSGCFSEKKDEQKSNIKIIKNGNRIDIISAKNINGGDFFIENFYCKDSITTDSKKLKIILNAKNGLDVSIAASDPIGIGETIFSINEIVNSPNIVEKSVVYTSSISPEIKREATDSLLGDFDGSNSTDLNDFVLFTKNYKTAYNTTFDIAPATKGIGIWSNIYSRATKDNIVDLLDFIVFAQNYSKTKPTSADVELKSLSLNDGKISLDPMFTPNISTYTAITEYATTAVAISAISGNSTDTITGTGTKPLNIGNNTMKITQSGSNGTIRNYTINIIRKTLSTKPTITLIEMSNIYLTTGKFYREFGAIAKDNLSQDISSKVKISRWQGNSEVTSINTDKPGVFTIKYNVTDNNGINADEVTRTVNIVNEFVDTEPPLPVTKTNYSGINLWGVVGWSAVRPFVDLMKESRPNWYDPYDIWNSKKPAPKDNFGWPTTDASIIVWEAEVDSSGIYTLVFNGKAQNINLHNVNGKVTDINYDSATNTTTAKIDVTQVMTGVIAFTGTQRTNSSPISSGITNVRLYRPGYATDGSEIFTKEFLAAVKKFQVVRFMDWNNTNSNPSRYWTERTLPEDASQDRELFDDTFGYMGSAGASYEHMIQLCNATNTDMWINIPVKADDNYIINLAKLIHHGRLGADGIFYPPLNSNLKIYLEYGNEVWNSGPGFWNLQWVGKLVEQAQENPNHPIIYDGNRDHWQGIYRYVGLRVANASDIFRAEFGDSQMMTRIRPVVESQLGGGWLQWALEFIEGYYSVSRDGKPPRSVKHFVYGAGGSAYYFGGPANDATSLMSNFFDTTSSEQGFINSLKKDIAITRDYGLRRVAYEGGPSLDYMNSAGQYILSNAQQRELNANTLMKDVTLRFHDIWSQYDGELLCYYVLGGGAPWEFTSDRLTDSNGIYPLTTPKMMAIQEITAKNRAATTVGNSIPGTLLVREIDNTMILTHWTGYPAVVAEKRVYDGLRYFSVPVNAKVAGKYKMTLNGRVFGNPNNSDDLKKGVTEIRVNGTLVGSINLVPAGLGVKDVLTDSTIELDIPEGLSMIRIKNDNMFTLYSLTFTKE